MKTAEFDAVFAQLRDILRKNRGGLRVAEDSATRYCLEAPVGPAAIKAWGGEKRKDAMPVAWTEIGKGYVSFHHMALYVMAGKKGAVPPALKKRMQGKTCFNFRKVGEIPVEELEALTTRGFAGMKAMGF